MLVDLPTLRWSARPLLLTVWLCAAGLAGGGASGCAGHRSACPQGTKGAKCRWEAERKASTAAARTDVAADFAGNKDPLGTGGIWGNVEQVLLRGQDVLTQGIVGEEIKNSLADMCEAPPLVKQTDTGRAWTCALAEPIKMYSGSFVLEIGEHGIVSLTALNLTTSSAERFLFVADNRWQQPRWCIEEISRPEVTRDDHGAEPPRGSSPEDAPAPTPSAAATAPNPANSGTADPASAAPESPSNHGSRAPRSWRCALPDRLALVAAQFPQPKGEDGEELWQVSLAVVGTR